jgi:thiol:disulfide interchange protein DsbC
MLRSLALIAALSAGLAAAAAQPIPPTPPTAPSALTAPTAALEPAAAAPAALTANPQTTPDPRIALLKLLPAGSKLEDMRPSPISGIYEFTQGADVSYITADGKFFLDGNLYDMHSRENLTEQLRTHARVALISAVPESQMLIFSPPNPKYTITVFTDIDCQYCRKLHSDIGELNKLGIRVRYMFFPRTGPNTESWTKAEVVWCSLDRNDAFTRAKLGANLDLKKTCPGTPIAREYQLGQDIGVRGTPAIVTDRGDFIAGYLPPLQLLAQIKEFQVATR